MEQQEIIDDLKDVFNNTNTWLSFAELKHGALIAFDTTIILGILSELGDKLDMWIVSFSLIAVTISLIISLYSYFPNLKSGKDKWIRVANKKKVHGENLLFYGDIYVLSPKQYLNKLYKTYYGKNNVEAFSKKEVDYAEEIVINSKIAMRKYSMFKVSLIVCIIGIGLLMASILIG